MKSWFEYQWLLLRSGARWNRLKDWMSMTIAFKLPKRIAYWSTIRVGAHATCGEWGNESPTDLKLMTAVERFGVK